MVQFLSKKEDCPEDHKTRRGDVVGEYCLCSRKRKHSLRCLTWSEFYCLQRSDIYSVILENYSRETGRKIWSRIVHKIRHSDRSQCRKMSMSVVLDKGKNKHMVHDLSDE